MAGIDEQVLINVVHDMRYSFSLPEYPMKNFPESWEYRGSEEDKHKKGLITASFHGPKEDYSRAVISINDLYSRYMKNEYITKFNVSKFNLGFR